MTWDEIKKQLSEQYVKIGKAQVEEEIVSNLLETGMKSEEISYMTGISIERVLEIKANHDFRYHADSLYRIENKRNINMLVKLERRD